MRFRPLLYSTHGMEWVSTSNVEHHGELQRGVLKSIEEIHSFRVLHLDLRADNILWNAELGRALIIDFHYAKMNLRESG